MRVSSTNERSFWIILGLSTFLALLGLSVSIWSIGSLKYQIKSLKDVEHKLAVSEKRFAQLNSTVKRQDTRFKQNLSQLNTTVKKIQGQYIR